MARKASPTTSTDGHSTYEGQKEKLNADAQAPSQPVLSTAAFQSASSLMGLQVFSRLVTFALNTALVRLATPQAYGTVSMQLELLLNTILFLSREGFRNALLRAEVGTLGERDRAVGDGKAKRGASKAEAMTGRVLVANIALLPLYFGVPVTLITTGLYRRYASQAVQAQPYFTPTVLLYGFAAFTDLVSEPLHIHSVQSLDPHTRVRAEGTAVIVRTAVTLAVLLYDALLLPTGKATTHLGLLAFALGQMAHALTLLYVYAARYGRNVSYILKRTQGSGKGRGWLDSWFDQSLLRVSTAMTVQGFVKHILTEGDKFIVSRVSPLQDQGGYAVANNYGSLIARVVFQPIEESSRLFFSKLLSTQDTHNNDSSPEAPSSSTLREALDSLTNLIKFYVHLCLLLLSLGPPYLRLALCVVLPRKYLSTSAPSVLGAWVWYIPVLAINGVLEAFVSSVATPADLARQSKWMAVFSIIYIFATLTLYKSTSLGDAAVVYANALNLGVRIAYCASFINRYTALQAKGRPTNVMTRSSAEAQPRFRWHATLPRLPVICTFALATFATKLSARWLNVDAYTQVSGLRVLFNKACLIHLGVGVLCGVSCLGVSALVEREHFARLVGALRDRFARRKDKTE